ncbi:MAG: voltage-gated chloride channel family protein [Bacteroidota bacterium]|nr:voltage-gated chloride channel family protein [Bacteroidota bacterium]
MQKEKSVFFPLFSRIKKSEHYSILFFTLKWLFIATIIGLLAGTTSALFLWVLDLATNYREANFYIIALLPIGGLLIGLFYHYLGKGVEAGNNQILEEIENPQKVIPLKMAPLVFIGTVLTHLFGGSAGREGTAVQISAAISDQFTRLFKFKPRDRKILLIIGISAGFASVFGTPLAGAVFGLEVFLIGRLRYDAIFPSFIAAIIADYITTLWGISHIHYKIPFIPEINILNILFSIIAGLSFGLTARIFGKAIHLTMDVFKNKITHPPLRPLIGGIIIAGFVFSTQSTRYIGLGLPVITQAFEQEMPFYEFIIKLALTAITLGASFKGGEVTPLFFIGATLGSALSFFIPFPVALLAGMGFVAVLAGAANTPLAATLVAIELFGLQIGVYAAIACVVSYLFSGHSGIYSAQTIGSSKHIVFIREEGKKLIEIKNFRKKH